MKKIICVHLYNDFSGSPLVLANAIKGFTQNGQTVEIVTSETEGFLSELNIPQKVISYNFHTNKWMRLFYYLWNQIQLFTYICSRRAESATIYINTLLPFGAAIAAKLTGQSVIYHIHETSIRPLLLKRFLKWIAGLTADHVVYVSDYLQQQEKIIAAPATVVYNALSTNFSQRANSFLEKPKAATKQFTVLMLCSLKKYKGVEEFVRLAVALPDYQFELVVNATHAEIEDYFAAYHLPANLSIFDKQKDVHPFYQRADLVLNLSDPNRWVETFGMTLLEAMHYGLPVIAPTVGGPTEVVVNGVNGYTIDSYEVDEIANKITLLAETPSLYATFSAAALHRTKAFKKEVFEQALLEVIATLNNEQLLALPIGSH